LGSTDKALGETGAMAADMAFDNWLYVQYLKADAVSSRDPGCRLRRCAKDGKDGVGGLRLASHVASRRHLTRQEQMPCGGSPFLAHPMNNILKKVGADVLETDFCYI
jgi:hypothetical protein